MSNYIIFIEGPDNCGKGSQIHEINRYFYPKIMFHTMHYGGVRKPGITPEQYLEYSRMYYSDMFRMIYLANTRGINLILDRSHLGEIIYAQKYRGYSGDYVLELEKHWDEELQNSYLITFYDKPENLIKREDGYSFSINKEDKIEEINKFIDAHDKSIIPHKLLMNIDGYGIKEVGKIVCEWLEKEMK